MRSAWLIYTCWLPDRLMPTRICLFVCSSFAQETNSFPQWHINFHKTYRTWNSSLQTRLAPAKRTEMTVRWTSNMQVVQNKSTYICLWFVGNFKSILLMLLSSVKNILTVVYQRRSADTVSQIFFHFYWGVIKRSEVIPGCSYKFCSTCSTAAGTPARSKCSVRQTEVLGHDPTISVRHKLVTLLFKTKYLVDAYFLVAVRNSEG